MFGWIETMVGTAKDALDELLTAENTAMLRYDDIDLGTGKTGTDNSGVGAYPAPSKTLTLRFGGTADTTPRAPLQVYVSNNYNGQPYRAFGEPGHDKYFGHSVAVPSNATSISVALDVTMGGGNDGMAVGVLPTGPRWGGRLSSFGLSTGQRGWIGANLYRESSSDNAPGRVIDAVRAAGFLDVLVQDDSMVHGLIVAIEVPA